MEQQNFSLEEMTERTFTFQSYVPDIGYTIITGYVNVYTVVAKF